MEKLIILYSANKNNPENTWSGTSYQLRKSLENYFEVIFIDIYEGPILRIFKKIWKMSSKKNKSNSFGIIYDNLYKCKVNRLLKQYKDLPVLQIGNEVLLKNKYYLYQDLSLAYVWDERINNDCLCGGGLRSEWSERELNRKTKLQYEVYLNSRHIFYMGNWITEYMKIRYPEIQNKFSCAGGGLNNGFNLREINNHISKKPFALFVGIDFERKGGKLLLEAFKILWDKNVAIELVIVGPGQIEKKNNVSYVGKLSRNELTFYFSNAYMFCMPSLFEAYGLVFLEALCFGLPVIGRNDYEMKYFINEGENGYLLKQNDANELANLIELCLSNKKMKLNVEKNRDFYLKQYSWETVANKIYNVIQKTK